MERESVNVLQECIDLQKKKSNDYQNDSSSVKQADYYVNGVSTIFDIMWAKMLRIKSIQEAIQNDPNYVPNFEGLEDSAKDLINYASFYAAYIRGKIDGQDPNKDIFNKKKKKVCTCGPKEVCSDCGNRNESMEEILKRLNKGND